MALSIGFGNSVALLPAIQATRLLTFASVGLSPTEHTCFSWSHMPYGRISQVRFEVLVMRRPWAFPAWRGLSADAQYAPTSMVCPGCSSISYVGSLSALCPTAPLTDGTTKYPESLCPVSALPPLGRRGPSPRRALPLPHRSYGLIRRSRHLSSTSALASLEESLQVVISPCR
jgi:hypothetical protein